MINAVLIFGAAKLQKSLIQRAKSIGLITIGIDPDPDAICRDILDVFEVVGAADFDKTLGIAKRFNIKGIITTATDKPLVMMAKIAKELNLHFFSVECAIISTDKFLMKKEFIKHSIPCAVGKIISGIDEIADFTFPIILKPRDNSGSRGVVFCENFEDVGESFNEAKQFTSKENILIEEYIVGKEYSVESLHHNGRTHVIQFTEKIVTPLPYNVELGHNQPAQLSSEEKSLIRCIIERMAIALNFENCASHTELKINDDGIFVIETSPRLGGDFITSNLVPLSTGINIEEELIKIAIGEKPHFNQHNNSNAIIRYLNLKQGIVNSLNLPIDPELHWKCNHFDCTLKVGEKIPEIKNSLNRYGEVIFSGADLTTVLNYYNYFFEDLNFIIEIDNV